MEPQHQEVRFLLTQKVDDRLNLPSFDQVTMDFDTVAGGEFARLVLQLFTELQTVIL
jgi:hypothetical protein